MIKRDKVIIKSIFSLFILMSLLSLFDNVFAIEPFGASINVTNSSSAQVDGAGSVPAQAGNVSELNIQGFSVTQSWQGYYGNVTGTIHLADSSDYIMYNWSAASPSGEVYASTNGTIQWSNIQCFNFTARGDYTSEDGNGGNTSLYGTNLTQLEGMFNINGSDVDGVDETFNLFGGATHDLFYTANRQFEEGECRSTRVFDSTGAGVSNNFEEVLLYEPSTRSVVFTSLIENNVNAFNNKTSDFEMLVLEDGHGTNIETTPYYFFVELQ